MVILRVNAVNNPLNTARIGDFTITTLLNGKPIDTGTGGGDFSFNPDELTEPAGGSWITPSSQIVNAETTYEFHF